VTARAALEHFWRGDQDFEESIHARNLLLSDRLDGIIGAAASDELTQKGRGMLRGLAMPTGEVASQVAQAAFESGLIVETSGSKGEVLKCMAPLNIDENDLHRGLDLLETAVHGVLKKRSRAAA
jgi:diaminobutyrate-2-oxoglutarate transaminase